MPKNSTLCLRSMILVAILSIALPSLAISEVPTPPNNVIGMSYFGMHIHRAETYWPHVKFGSSRLWDAGTDWASLEPIRGHWNFERLDKYVGLALRNNIEPVLVLGNSPTWASSRPRELSAYNSGGAAGPQRLSDWENYIRTVATRYRNKVRYYEIWNEPNLPKFYSGNVGEMLELARIAYVTLKKVDSQIQVISPSPTEKRGLKWLDEYLRQGGGNYTDIVGYHFYVQPAQPEMMVPLIGQVRELMTRYGLEAKQLWNTESGWNISHQQHGDAPSNTLSTEQASEYVARSLILNWASGVSRFYWYAWDNGKMGLIERNNARSTQPTKAYAEVQRWLHGAVMESCNADIEGTWVCKLRRSNGISWIIWNPQKKVVFRDFREWRPGHVTDIRGSISTFNNVLEVEVGRAPQFFER